MRLKVFFKVRLGWKNIKIIDGAENIKNTYSAFPVQKKNTFRWSNHYFLLPSEKWRSCARSSASVFCRMSKKTRATLNLFFMTAFLIPEASAESIKPVRTIESIRSSNSRHNDCSFPSESAVVKINKFVINYLLNNLTTKKKNSITKPNLLTASNCWILSSNNCFSLFALLSSSTATRRSLFK